MSNVDSGLERDSYVARSASLADAPAILRVFELAYDAWPSVELSGTALEHLEWKLSAPGHDASPATVATRDGEVVAALVRWFAAGTIDGVAVAVNSTVDLAVHPDHRRRGLIRLMDEHDIEAGVGGDVGVDLASNHEAVQHLFEETEVLRRPVRTWTRPLGLRRAATRFVRSARSPRAIPSLLASALRRIAPSPRSSEAVIEVVSAFDERADVLWSAFARDFAYSRMRDATYLNWRHADPRSGERTILAAYASGGAGAPLLAWAVLRPDGDALRIVDLAVHPDREVVSAELLDRCVGVAADRGAHSLVTWLPAGHPAERWHRRAGLLPSGETTFVQVWITKESSASPELIEPLVDTNVPVHLAMADLDFY